MKKILTLFLITILIVGCKNKQKQTNEVKHNFTVNAKFKDIDTGEAVIYWKKNGEKIIDTIKINDGQFKYEEYCEEYASATMMLNKKSLSFYIEKGEININGDAEKLRDADVQGGPIHQSLTKYEKFKQKSFEEFDKKHKDSEQLDPDDLTVYHKINALADSLDTQFLKVYPLEPYVVVVFKNKIIGKTVKEIRKFLNEKFPEIKENKWMKDYLKSLEEKEKMEMGLADVMPNASNVSYKVDYGFKGKKYIDLVYLSASNEGLIYGVKKDGTVLVINENGGLVSTLNIEMDGEASTIFVDGDKIYIGATLVVLKDVKVRGKLISQKRNVGAECVVCDLKGKELSRFKISEMSALSGMKVHKDDLLVTDSKKGILFFLDKTNGKIKKTIKNLRSCCMILDFTIDNKDNILVADLGAFRVRGFDANGKEFLSFGSRGDELDQFLGCCNPVGVATLSNGAIVTVEKDPTRIKVYSKDGAKQIQGIQELVKGCAYIPMTVDNKDNLYLASKEKGLVKCVSIN